MTTLKFILQGMCVCLWLSAGCANTKTATAMLAHGAIDAACTVVHRGVVLALGPIEDVQANATIVVDALTKPAQ